jgi:tetratricopeptide (TPR) repeat protein
MVSSYKSFFNPTNMLIVVALLALILFRHALFPEATESTEVKQLMGKMDNVINNMQSGDEAKFEQQLSSSKSSDSDEKTEVPMPVATANDSADENIATAPSVLPPVVADEKHADAKKALSVWQTARRAAWDGNSDAAVANYRALIKLQPSNYDAYGEMGNVLLQQGDKQGAVDAFSQAALLLGKSGYPQAAWHVMNIVSQLDQAKAEQLHQTLYGQPLPVSQ